MSTVVKVTVRARPNEVHVGRSLHGPLLMLSKKSLVDQAMSFSFEFSKNADTGKPHYNVSLATAILQHYIKNNVISRLFYMSTYGEGEIFLNIITG